MERKKTGFTLLEMIIVVALITVVLGITASMFITGNKVFSDSDVKSTLQIEGQKIQEEISSIGMQSSGISSINGLKSGNGNISIDNEENVDATYSKLKSESKLTDVQGMNTDNKWLTAGKITMNYYYEDTNDDSNIESRQVDIEFENNADGSLMKQANGGTFTLVADGKELSSNVKSIRIKPINIEDSNGDFNNNGTFEGANSVLINIELEKKKGFSDVIYPLSIQVKFRNNFIKQ